jgi:hypothetical protein
VRGCVAAEAAITSNLALVGKLLGMIVQRHDVRSTSILVSADYLALRQAIVTALRPFPAAAAAVGVALHHLEAAAAKDITARAAVPVTIEHETTQPPDAPRVQPLPPPQC